MGDWQAADLWRERARVAEADLEELRQHVRDLYENRVESPTKMRNRIRRAFFSGAMERTIPGEMTEQGER